MKHYVYVVKDGVGCVEVYTEDDPAISMYWAIQDHDPFQK